MTIHDPHSFADLEQGKISHIDLALNVDFDSKTIQGEAIYDLNRPINGSFYLDSQGVQIQSINAGERPLSWALDRSNPILGERLHIENLPDVERFKITFRTSPNAGALQWMAPEQTAAGRHPFLFSQCQAIHARSIFPCQDTPSVRFTYQATIRVPADLEAVMAAASSGSARKDGGRLFHFNMPQPVPSYLFALAVGDLDHRDLSPRVRLYAESPVIEEAAWEFAQTERALQEAEALFGPYEWDRYDMLVMPPSFPYGGMENPRLTFLTPTIIAGDRSLTDVITHELAHSWTGNLVTNATWEDFWLNEGWTVYAERRITERLSGPDVVALHRAIDLAKMKETMERLGEDTWASHLKLDFEGHDPVGYLTDIQYTKGCELLTLLEHLAGRPDFDAFVRKYIQTFRFRSLTTEQFLDYLGRELPQVVDQIDLEEWIHGPGLPENALPVRSRLLDDVRELAAAYQGGRLPGPDDISGWIGPQVYLFLLEMPKTIPEEDCRQLEKIFGLERSTNDFQLAAFFEIAICSGYQEIWPRVESMVQRVGRIILIARVMRALSRADWTRPRARPLFEKVQERHHPITRAYLDKLLEKANL